MGFKCGIVGLPNVGKSTLFNALTKAGIQAENYPFCTIEPNVGVVPVPDPRMQKIIDIAKPRNIVPAVMEFVDIAGLVAGASKGEGLGNQFLANIRETDAILHVVRCFENDDILHVANRVDPVGDIEVIQTELLLADCETVQKSLQRAGKVAKTGNKDAVAQRDFYEALANHLDAGQLARTFEMTEQQCAWVKSLHLITQKPVLYVANVDDSELDQNPHYQAVLKHAASESADVIAISAQTEAEIAELPDDERDEFLEELGMSEPGLDRLIRAGYGLLSLQTYFTAGEKEARAWTIPVGATAPEAAGKIHTDFQKGFIRAEVIGYEDYVNLGGETGAKSAGKWRLEGKDYVVQDGDVILFRFNV